MVYESIAEWIRDASDEDDVPDRLITAYWLYRNEYTDPDEQRCKTSKVEDAVGDRLDDDPLDVLADLADLGVVHQYERTSESIIFHDREEKAIWSPASDEFEPMLHEEISRLVYDLHLREGRGESGPFPDDLHLPKIAPITDGGVAARDISANGACSLRIFVAEELEVEPLEVEDALVAPIDLVDRMEQYDDLVVAIRESDAVERGLEYDRIQWLGVSHRWALSQRATYLERYDSIAP